MQLIDRGRIEAGVLNMLRVNMGIKEGEKILVVTDPPSLERWRQGDSTMIGQALERCMLAKMVSEIAAEHFPPCPVEFFPYPQVARSGAEPGEEVAQKMREADVVIAITNLSLSHTDARQKACQAGARIASMPGFLTRMFYPEGPMAADYHAVAKRTGPIAERLTKAETAVVRSRAGTDLTFSLAGRQGFSDTGLLTAQGAFGNLPAGEAYIAPLEGTAEGKLAVEKGRAPGLAENMVLSFQGGMVQEIEGGGEVGEKLRQLLGLEQGEEEHRERRNLAELGVGTNPKASSTENVLESEKIMGTVHIAIGDNAHIGGAVNTDLHRDFVIPRADLVLDGEEIMIDGKLQI
ncbi:MAG: aminopeptidase [Anaerolineae bacterium]